MNIANFSDFSNPQFNAWDWINSSVETMGTADDLDSFLSGLAMKVQVLSQDCGDYIEGQMGMLLNRLPEMVGIPVIYFIHIANRGCGAIRKHGNT